MRHRTPGFTLIETMAAVFLTGLVIVVAVSFYIDISRSTAAAVTFTQAGRQALGIVDRVARDLEGAFLIVPDSDADPLYHPWVFIAENHHVSSGADQLHLISTTQRPRSRGAISNIATVSYALRPAASGGRGYDLIRRVVPGRPTEPPTDFPRGDEPGSIVLATELASFSLRFLSASGGMQESWDSSQLVESGALPIAVEINVGLFEEANGDDVDDFAEYDDDVREFSRTVALPMRAMTMDQLLGQTDLLAQGEDESENCHVPRITFRACIDAVKAAGGNCASLTVNNFGPSTANLDSCMTGDGKGWGCDLSVCGF